ncbi:hypothetical protein PKOR_18655 [Pontibacter korlensis]|uniref:Uncharacterized protein n=1 Tax=Pontibacter korlensis TaxID=400092 RepID=A0A0E3ZIM4_9BACT|nr:hypothetical protein PKOR_18655 [Pontibacter korlensis]
MFYHLFYLLPILRKLHISCCCSGLLQYELVQLNFNGKREVINKVKRKQKTAELGWLQRFFES